MVVGNLTVGGSGKTPLVLEIAKHCAVDWKPAIVSRGYGAHMDQFPYLLQSTDNARDVADEPLVLFRHSGLPVVIGPDRHADIALAKEARHCDLAVLDDGFQHAALEPDLSLIVVEGQRVFGNGQCLPAGPLREPLDGLSRADAIICHGRLMRELPPIAATKPIFHMRLQATHLASLDPRLPDRELDWLRGQRVHAVAGIGHPERFFYHLQMLDAFPIPHPFPDHHGYSLRDFLGMHDAPIVMTAKDAVKCHRFALENAWVLHVKAELDPEFWIWLDDRLAHLRKAHEH